MSAGHEVGYKEFSEWERKLAKRKAMEKAKQLNTAAVDANDLEQEFLLKIWLKRRAYDPVHHSKSSFETFMRRVVENRFLDLAKAEQKDKRSIHHHIDSLDREIETEDCDVATVGDRIKGDDNWFDSELGTLRATLETALSFLSKSQVTILRLLMSGHTIAQISRKTKTPWSSVKDEIIKMRGSLYDAGLRDFLSP